MKTKINNLILLCINIFTFIFVSIGFSQGYSFGDATNVPFFRGIEVDNTRRLIVWDLNEIFDNRLDLFVGVNQSGGYPGQTTYYYYNANWYKNESDNQ